MLLLYNCKCRYSTLFRLTPFACPLKLLREAHKKSAPRTILRRKHPDARTIPKLVNMVEKVDHGEAHRKGLPVRQDKLMRQARLNWV